MAKAKEKPAKKPKPKQGYLDPSLAPPSIKEIDDAAEDFVDARDARMRLAEKEAEKKAVLEGMMKKHQLKTYEYDSKVVSFDEVIHVKKKKVQKDEG